MTDDNICNKPNLQETRNRDMNIPTAIMLKGVYRSVPSHKHRWQAAVKGQIILLGDLDSDTMTRALIKLESIQDICEETGTRHRRIFG